MPVMPAPVEKPTSASVLDNDVYAATITLAKPVMENGTFAITENGKAQVDLRFQLDDEQDDEGNPIVLYRSKMAVSYGQYAGKWADWAALIAAALGIVEGDKAQRNVDTDELVGKKVRVQTAKVASTKGDGKVYVNCVGYLAPKKAKPAPVAALVDYPATVAAPAAKTPAERLGLEDADLSDLPF
jgi:hypothetical protein